jgi:hypothetical protein
LTARSINELSWEGHELTQMKAFKALPIEEKFQIIEEMCEIQHFFAHKRMIRKNTTS